MLLRSLASQAELQKGWSVRSGSGGGGDDDDDDGALTDAIAMSLHISETSAKVASALVAAVDMGMLPPPPRADDDGGAAAAGGGGGGGGGASSGRRGAEGGGGGGGGGAASRGRGGEDDSAAAAAAYVRAMRPLQFDTVALLAMVHRRLHPSD